MLHTRTLIVIMMLLLLSTSPPASAARSEDGRYIAGEGITIWCGAEPHDLVPDGLPQKHESLTGWLFSGEPECALSDALNTVDDDPKPTGYAGYAWLWHNLAFPVGDAFSVTTIDDVFGTGDSYLQLFHDTFDWTRNSVEGCGAQSLVLEPHPYSWGWESPAIVWAHIPPVGIEPDLTTCFASKGLVESELTPA